MLNLRRPISIFSSTAAVVFVLAGCETVTIEPTDLSVMTVEKDRASIEKALGKPDEEVESRGLTLAAYTYDKGRSKTYGGAISGLAKDNQSGQSVCRGQAALGCVLIAIIAEPFV